MQKTIDARIAYYTHKVAEWSGTYKTHDPVRRTRRHKRLLAYKTAMHKRIEHEKSPLR